MKKGEKAKGICRLTGIKGEFVDAHIIPRALTRLDQNGSAMVQYGVGLRPKRRWNSWYDPALVTQNGENIFKELDTWGIKELRKLKLVWSGWGEAANIEGQYEKIEGTPYGIRKIHTQKQEKLRRFFMSILWRAAATSLPEFSEIKISEEELNRLGLYICEKEDLCLSFYPAIIMQHSTIGIPHNFAPMASTKKTDITNPSSPEVEMYRFYFDGLMVHFHRTLNRSEEELKSDNTIVGAMKELVISTIEYNHSFQGKNTLKLMKSYYESIPK